MMKFGTLVALGGHQRGPDLNIQMYATNFLLFSFRK